MAVTIATLYILSIILISQRAVTGFDKHVHVVFYKPQKENVRKPLLYIN